MQDLGLHGVVRGRKRRTTIPNELATPARPAKAAVPRQPAEPAVGGRLHLRRDLVGVRLRGLHDRCVRASHHRLARGALDAHGTGPRSLEEAWWIRSDATGVVHHSERGRQYLSILRRPRFSGHGFGVKSCLETEWEMLNKRMEVGLRRARWKERVARLEASPARRLK